MSSHPSPFPRGCPRSYLQAWPEPAIPITIGKWPIPVKRRSPALDSLVGSHTVYVEPVQVWEGSLAMIASTTLTEAAQKQGQLWGARARDWASIQEQKTLALHAAVLDAAGVQPGIRLLDAGAGAGLVALLGRLRGAEVTAFDASDDLVEIARERLPGADVRVAELEALPYDDAEFDAVVAVNSLFYATDHRTATVELARVVRPGGRVVVTTWGPEDQCASAAGLQALGRLLPPPPPGFKPGGPFAYSAPGAVESLLESAGLHPIERGTVSCPFAYPNSEISIAGQFSSGVVQRAIEHSGPGTVREEIEEMDAQYTQPDGSIRYDNVFVWVAAVR